MKDGLEEVSKLSGIVKPKNHSMISRKESSKCASVRYSGKRYSAEIFVYQFAV